MKNRTLQRRRIFGKKRTKIKPQLLTHLQTPRTQMIGVWPRDHIHQINFIAFSFSAMTYFNTYIGQRLRTLRVERGVSAAQAAEALGISLDIYQQSEIGLRRIPVSEIFAARKFLNISIEDFFTHDGMYISDLDHDIACADMSDLIHYFSNIKDIQRRQSFIDQIKDASSVF